MIGALSFKTVVGNPGAPDDADVLITFNVTDVRNQTGSPTTRASCRGER